MPTVNVNRLIERRCPKCGELRPVDWFCSTSAACWRCRALDPAGAGSLAEPDAAAAKREMAKRERMACKRGLVS